MPDLKGVTAIIIDTITPDLGKIALEDFLSKATPSDVVIYSDHDWNVPGVRFVKIENYPTKLEWSECYWYTVPQHIETEQTLFVSWDSGIYYPDMWRDEFLKYDYIGAPWGQYADGMNVGNSGFSLRSKRLMDFLIKARDHYPVKDPEDVALSRDYRPDAEKHGFKWATDGIALDFAFECNRPFQGSKHFGFHAMRNWPYVLHPDDLERRVRLAMKHPYIHRTGMIDQIKQTAPYLAFHEMEGY